MPTKFGRSTRPISADPGDSADGMKSAHLWKPLLFVLLAGLTICWTFATPLFGISDETAHVMKAAAVVRGQFVGKPDGGPNTIVDIPENLIGRDRIPCFMSRNYVNAGCEAPLGHDDRSVPEVTWVGYYPPLYYLLVGWPSLLFEAASAIYAMRVASALLSAGMLTWALLSAIEARGRSLLVPATAALATPYLFAYASTVNPSGLEMSSALSAWTSGVALANGPSQQVRRRILVRFVVSLAFLSQIRDLGPVFVVAIALALAAWYGVPETVELLRRRATKLIVLGVGLCVAFMAIWVFAIAKLNFVPNSNLAPHAGILTTIGRSAERYGTDLQQLVGAFGWNDTPPPHWVTDLGLGVMAMLLSIGLLFATNRQRLIAAALAAFSVVFPIVLIAAAARENGILGQGRYWFPLLAGVLIVAAEAGGSRLAKANWPLWAVVAVSAVTIDVVCFQVALDRFRFGVGQPEVRAGWNPPGGADLWPVVYAALSVLFAWWWWRHWRDDRSLTQLASATPTTLGDKQAIMSPATASSAS
jgi:Predicted membrane protein (DUF2142)